MRNYTPNKSTVCIYAYLRCISSFSKDDYTGTQCHGRSYINKCVPVVCFSGETERRPSKIIEEKGKSRERRTNKDSSAPSIGGRAVIFELRRTTDDQQ